MAVDGLCVSPFYGGRGALGGHHCSPGTGRNVRRAHAVAAATGQSAHTAEDCVTHTREDWCTTVYCGYIVVETVCAGFCMAWW